MGDEFRRAADTIAADLTSVSRVVVTGGADHQYERWLVGAEPAAGLPGPPTDACFLQVYTSGTTGFPEGAMLTSANLTAHAMAVGPATGLGRGSVVVAGVPAFHVIVRYSWDPPSRRDAALG